jgi:hypothetical protein
MTDALRLEAHKLVVEAFDAKTVAGMVTKLSAKAKESGVNAAGVVAALKAELAATGLSGEAVEAFVAGPLALLLKKEKALAAAAESAAVSAASVVKGWLLRYLFSCFGSGAAAAAPAAAPAAPAPAAAAAVDAVLEIRTTESTTQESAAPLPSQVVDTPPQNTSS